jgi:hypothetical protein
VEILLDCVEQELLLYDQTANFSGEKPWKEG